MRIPQNLFPSIQRLTVASAGLKILKGAGLNNYSSTLRDMYVCLIHNKEDSMVLKCSFQLQNVNKS